MKRFLLLILIIYAAGSLNAQSRDAMPGNKAKRNNTKQKHTASAQTQKSRNKKTAPMQGAVLSVKDTASAASIKINTAAADTSKNIITAAAAKSDSVIVPDSLDADSTVSDTLKPAPLYPLTVRSLRLGGEYDNVISRREILYNEYRYAGDFLRYFPLAFNRYLGLLGQPHELTVYGAGFNEVTYMQDGLSLNNPISNSLDLNTIQSEFVDSVEVIPAARGFLYSNFNNPVSVNFISRDHFAVGQSKAPYTRVRYIQGPNEEAFIDFIYRAYLFRRLIAIADITNSTVDPEYFGERSYGAWQGTARLKYLLSNSFNITASYRYLKQRTSLFGGIDIRRSAANAARTGLPVSNYLFDELAPSTYLTRYKKVTDHYFNLKLAGKPLESTFTSLNLYYNSNLNEFRQNEAYDSASAELPVYHNNRYKLWGASLRQSLNLGFYNAEVIAGYESVDFNTPLLIKRSRLNSYSLSGKMVFSFIDSSVVPAAFAKYLNYDTRSYAGLGADVTLRYNELITLYGGASYFSRPLNVLEEQYPDQYLNTQLASQYGIQLHDNSGTDINVSNIELGARLKTGLIDASLSLFSRKTDGYLSPVLERSTERVLDFIREDVNTSGIGLKLNAAWKFLRLETNSALYYSDRNGTRRYSLPEYSLRGAIFFQDTLFESNLFLRTGFQGFNTGMQDFYQYDFETNLRAENFVSRPVYLPPVEQKRISSHWQVDFVLAAEIRRRAVIYFIYENLFGTQYFTVPYFTNMGSGIRVGASWEFLN